MNVSFRVQHTNTHTHTYRHLDIQVSCSQSFVSFFDLFGDMMTLTRLDEEDSICWNLHFLESQALNFARTALKRSEQTMSRGVAVGILKNRMMQYRSRR